MNEPVTTGDATNEYQAPFVVRLMKVLVNITWYLSIFASMLIVLILMAMSVKNVYPDHLTIQVPLEIYYPDKDENISVGDLNYPAVVGFRGIVSFRAHEEYMPLAVNISFAVALLLGAMVYGLYQLRLLMQTVSVGNPFHDKNPLRMRIIGFITIFWGPAVSIAMYLNARHLFAGGRSLLESMTNVEIEIVWQGQNGLVVMGLVILVLAQVFSVGVDLQHDKDLTI